MSFMSRVPCGPVLRQKQVPDVALEKPCLNFASTAPEIGGPSSLRLSYISECLLFG